MATYRQLFARLKLNPSRREDRIRNQAELVKALEVRASQERLRLALMIGGKVA